MKRIGPIERRKLFGDVFGNYEGAWLRSGRSLKEAADILAKDRELRFGQNDWFVEFDAHMKAPSKKGLLGLSQSYFFMPATLMPEYMLYGYAIENFLNALCIRRKMTLYKGGKRVLRGDHDLIALAEHAGLELSKSERSTLGSLATIIMVHGRYPLEKDVSKPKPRIDWQELSIKKIQRLMMKIALSSTSEAASEDVKRKPNGAGCGR